ncbi:hypothetical protein D3C81_1265760 [compost metagenome]
MLGILRDGQHVEPLRRAFLGDRIGHVHAIAGFGRAVAGLDDVTRPAHHQAGTAVGQRADVLRGVEILHVRADRLQQVRCLLQVGRIAAVRIQAQVVQRDRNHVRRRVQDGHAAVLHLADVFRLEHQVPAVGDVGAATETLLQHVHVVADAGGADHVRHTVLVARILGGDTLHHRRVEVGQVRDLRLVQRQEHTGLDLPTEEVQRRHHHVVAAVAGQQLGLDHLVTVEHIVGDLDPALLLEVRDGVFGDVVAVVVDVQDLAVLSAAVAAATGGKHGGGQAEREDTQLHRVLQNAERGAGRAGDGCQPTRRRRIFLFAAFTRSAAGTRAPTN